MSKAQQTLAQAFLERISRGAVPMGGFYWVDPKALRGRIAHAGTSATGKAEVLAAKARQPGAMTSQPSALASQPSAITWRPLALAQRVGLFLIGAHASIREPSETVSTGCTQHAPGEHS
jgi:hypothetical protein